jgi:hypothetical protein
MSNINIFKDTSGSFVFVDAQLLFRKSFIGKESDLLKTILRNYTTDYNRLKQSWDAALLGEIPLNANDNAWVLTVCTMMIEADNFRSQKAFEAMGGVKLTYNLENPNLDEDQLAFYKENILSYFSSNIGRDGLFFPAYKELETKVFDEVVKSENITTLAGSSAEFDYRFPAGGRNYELFTLKGSDGKTIFAEIDYRGRAFVPKGVLSINTLVFPTTIAPLVDGPSESSIIKAKSELSKMSEHFEQHNRVSSSGHISQKSREYLFEHAQSIVNDAKKNNTVNDIVTAAQLDLANSVQALSKDRSSAYFGMTPKDIKAGLLARIFGSSQGYGTFAAEVDNAIKDAVTAIDTNYATAKVYNNLFLFDTDTDESKVQAQITEINKQIQDISKNVKDLVWYVTPIIEIDDKALETRGFKKEYPEITLARANEAVTTTAATSIGLGSIAIILVVSGICIASLLKYLSLSNEENLKAIHIAYNSYIKKLEDTCKLRSLEDIKVDLNDLLTHLCNDIITFKSYFNSANVSMAVNKLKSLRTNIEAAIDNENTLENMQKWCASTRKQVKVDIKAIEDAIDLQRSTTIELDKYDVLGNLFKLGTDTLGSWTDVLKYAGYIALGMASIWGGVKVYRSLNDE